MSLFQRKEGAARSWSTMVAFQDRGTSRGGAAQLGHGGEADPSSVVLRGQLLSLRGAQATPTIRGFGDSGSPWEDRTPS